MRPSQAAMWLAGYLKLKRGGIELVEEKGLDAALEECPHDDLTEAERATFEACLAVPELVEHEKAWWPLYDAKREAGAVPRAIAADDDQPPPPWWP